MATLPETVPAWIARWAEDAPNTPALLDIGGDAVSFGQLQERLEDFGRGLAAAGIGRDERVVLALPIGIAGAIATLAVMRSAVAVPVDPALSPQEAADALAVVQPRALIVARDTGASFRESAARLGIAVVEIDRTGALVAGSMAAGATVTSGPEPVGDDLALILLTSGTTARPRGVPASHRDVLASAVALVTARRSTPRDRNLNVAPVYFIMGIGSLIASLISGGSAIVTSPAEIVEHPEAVRDLAPTWTSMVPALLVTLLEAARENPVFAQWPFRFVRASGALVSPDVLARVEELWQAPVYNGYGATETLGLIASEEGPGTVQHKPGSVGVARPGMQLAIVSADGDVLPAGAIGEIVTRGRHVFRGYLDDPEASRAVFFPCGWYRTGDLGYLDDEEYLFVTGRLRELINRGGEKVAPHEVDEVLRAHPAVVDAAAFALPSPHLGEEVAAAVVIRPGAAVNPRALRTWVGERLSPHKIPRKIWLVTEIPRTGSGKVQRGVLTERYGEADRGVTR